MGHYTSASRGPFSGDEGTAEEKPRGANSLFYLRSVAIWKPAYRETVFLGLERATRPAKGKAGPPPRPGGRSKTPFPLVQHKASKCSLPVQEHPAQRNLPLWQVSFRLA